MSEETRQRGEKILDRLGASVEDFAALNEHAASERADGYKIGAVEALKWAWQQSDDDEFDWDGIRDAIDNVEATGELPKEETQ